MIGRLATLVMVGILSASGQSVPESDAEFDGLARTGIDQVYNLDFEGAERTFGTVIAMRPSHPAGYFFMAMVDWWRIMIDIDNEEYDERFYAQLDHVVAMCDSMLELNPNNITAIFFKGGSIGFQGRLKFHRNDYLGAANAGRKALPLVQLASSLDPSNYDILLGTGIYNYYAEVVPNEYPIAKPLLLFIPPGDRKKGIAELTLAAEKAKYAAVESAYFLMQIYYFYERDYFKALSLASTLHRRFPNNMLFHRYVGRCQAAMGNWTETRDCFAEIVGRARKGDRGYTAMAEREAEYYLGTSEMAFGKFPEALTHFYRCDELSRTLDRKEPSGFMAMANLKIGNVYDVQGKRDLAVEQYNKVLGLKDYRGSHDLAETYLKNPFGR